MRLMTSRHAGQVNAFHARPDRTSAMEQLFIGIVRNGLLHLVLPRLAPPRPRSG